MADADWDLLSQSSSPSAFSDTSSNHHAVGLGPVHSHHSSFEYHRLPEPPLRLSILKLDHSSFDVKIGLTATVSELRTAVETVFRHRNSEDTEGISWTHVWGHFCLCYQHYKLVDDKACIRDYGIQDGDQLRFIRHLSVESPTKSQPNDCETTAELNLLYDTKTSFLVKQFLHFAFPSKLKFVRFDSRRRLTEPDDPPGDSRCNSMGSRSSPVTPDEETVFFRKSQNRSEEIVVSRTEFRLLHWLRTWISNTRFSSPRSSRKTQRTPKTGEYF